MAIDDSVQPKRLRCDHCEEHFPMHYYYGQFVSLCCVCIGCDGAHILRKTEYGPWPQLRRSKDVCSGA